jgi:AbrB family looped-hinge helix DNA binding protein
MSGENISSVDTKGRVLIPQGLRDALNLKSGERVILELDPETKAIRLSSSHEKKLLRLRIQLDDKPGSLASAATALADMGVDLVNTHSHSSERGERAVWMVDCNPGKASVADIKAGLAKCWAKLLTAEWE